MIDLKAFRKANGLNQVELARFLGIGQSFISQIEKGDRQLPSDAMAKIIANPEWDHSALVGTSQVNTASVVINGNENCNNHIDNRHYYSDSPDVLRAQIELLDERIKEKDAQIKEKDAQIKEKDAQIKQLLDILAKK